MTMKKIVSSGILKKYTELPWTDNRQSPENTSNDHELNWCEWVISKFNGTSTPKGSYSAKSGLKLPYESKQSPLEKNSMVKWVQSPRWDVKSWTELDTHQKIHRVTMNWNWTITKKYTEWP